jgi:Holliday junction resolvase RusA-like endonuclease
MPERVRLVLYADFCCKKNRIRAGKGGGHYPKEVKATLENLTLQARAQWGPRKPVASPSMEIFLYIKNKRKDRDGIWQTILDCLVAARVLFDDSLEWLNGQEVKHRAEFVSHIRDERVEILMEFER